MSSKTERQLHCYTIPFRGHKSCDSVCSPILSSSLGVWKSPPPSLQTACIRVTFVLRDSSDAGSHISNEVQFYRRTHRSSVSQLVVWIKNTTSSSPFNPGSFHFMKACPRVLGNVRVVRDNKVNDVLVDNGLKILLTAWKAVRMFTRYAQQIFILCRHQEF